MSTVNLPARVRYGEEVVGSLRSRARSLAGPADLTDELSLLRVLLDDAVEAYDNAVAEAQAKNLDVSRVRLAAGGLVAMAIERLERVAYTQSRISSAKFVSMPDVNALIEQFVGTVDTALAQHAGNLRMAGVDPAHFMQQLAGQLREVQAAQLGAVMTPTGPHGYASLAEARAAAQAEADAMDNTVPECTVVLNENAPADEEAA
jgi:hypothetical protein